MTKQESLTDRVNSKARAMVGAGGVHKLGEMSYRMPSLSKPGTYHDVFLRWENGSEPGMTKGLNASCAWVEPVTGSQTHCAGNGNGTACWHVLAAVIEALENADKGKKVAFFANKERAELYAHLGGHVTPIINRSVWFVVNGKRRRSVAHDMAALHGEGQPNDTPNP